MMKKVTETLEKVIESPSFDWLDFKLKISNSINISNNFVFHFILFHSKLGELQAIWESIL